MKTDERQTFFIPHRRFDTLTREIERCQQMTARSGEPYCMSLEGPTGAGKTRLVQHYLAQHPPITTEAGLTRPVFYLVTPAETTVKGLAEQMLHALGDPGSHKGTRTQMDFRLDNLIRVCGVRLVILDDFHHLLNIATERRLKAVSDWLKVRIKNTGKTFVIVGIPGEIAKVLNYNPQLSRLFASRSTLDPFPWEGSMREQIVEFDLFVRLVEKALAVSFSDELPRVELLYRLHYATNGLVGNVVTLVRYAALLVDDPSKGVIDCQRLAQAFTSSMREHLKHRHNPFAAHHGSRFVAS
jgi:hypothetical protein